MLDPMYFVNQRTTAYATMADLFKTFTEEMRSLSVLSLLLTADKDQAEECFVCAMGECVEGIGVFMEWAHLWARRGVLKYAIRMIAPVPEHPDSLTFISPKRPATAKKVPSPQLSHWAPSSALSSSCRSSKGSPSRNARSFLDARGAMS
jgi:hypothetical protein